MIDILVVVMGAVLFGFFLIFLLAFADKKQKQRSPTPEQLLPQEQFEKFCVEIIERMKLDIESIERAEDNSLEIMAKNPAPFVGGTLYVRCIYLQPEQIISSPEILEISNMIVQDRLSKGIMITTGRFTDEIPSLIELAPMEFIDYEKFKGLLQQWNLRN